MSTKTNDDLPRSSQPPSQAAMVVSSSNTQSRLQEIRPIKETLERYLAAIRSIEVTAQIALPHISEWRRSEITKIQKKIERFVPELSEKRKIQKALSFQTARDFAEFTATIRQLDEIRSQKATTVLTKSLFTQLFAEFDAYIGNLLKVIYIKNDKLLKSISREISLSDLLDFDDLNSVKLSMLDKEIETFRRDSYIEQFSTLEKKFNLSLKKFKEWSDFVELSQRRNILIHNGGMVSDQYLLICDREGYRFQERPKFGESLSVTFEYFSDANRLLSKVGLMLAFTLWSKIFPEETEQIHNALNITIFHALELKRWQFVAELQDFVLGESMRKNISEIDYRIRIVNASIGLKFSDKDEEAVKLLGSVDWSASYRDFKLAIAVLQERYSDAVEIMKSIGKTGEIIRQTDYHTWPLFTRFRERPEFYEAYFEIYGESFAEKVKIDKGPVEAQANFASQSSSPTSVANIIETDVREAASPKSEGTRSPPRSRDEDTKPKTARKKRVIS